MRKPTRLCAVLLIASTMLCGLSVKLYAGSVDTLDRARAVYKDAEALYEAARELNETAKVVIEYPPLLTAERGEVSTVANEDEVIRGGQLQKELPPMEIPMTCAPEPASLGQYTVTGYCPCEICCGHWAENRPVDAAGNPIVYTATGAVAKAGTTIAVDPSVIPYGTTVSFEGPDGLTEYVAQDCGGAVDGQHIDLYFDSHEEALAWGTKTREVFRSV